jgi:mannose-6-phosphate isomerase-like protein (cupin superfamily)
MRQGNRIMDGSRLAGFAEAPAAAFVADGPALPAPAAILAEGTRFRVRTLHLAPGEATSLQSHIHRSEHWVVVEGTAEITVGVRARLVVEGDAVHVPLGQWHRLENPGRLPVTLIAVETGCYLGEDDVIRHDKS